MTNLPKLMYKYSWSAKVALFNDDLSIMCLDEYGLKFTLTCINKFLFKASEGSSASSSSKITSSIKLSPQKRKSGDFTTKRQQKSRKKDDLIDTSIEEIDLVDDDETTCHLTSGILTVLHHTVILRLTTCMTRDPPIPYFDKLTACFLLK